MKNVIFWFRDDLRLADNPGLLLASKNTAVFPVFIFDEQDNKLPLGAVAKWWLYNSLHGLSTQLDNKLNVYSGNAQKILLKIVKQHDIAQIYWNRRYESSQIKQDEEITQFFASKGVECVESPANLLWEPQEILKKDGTPYKIYTCFYKQCLKTESPRKPLATPHNLRLLHDKNNATTLAKSLDASSMREQQDLAKHWQVGEKAAHSYLKKFLAHGLSDYKKNRNFPAIAGTSKLSPYLRFGQISPHQVWHAVQKKIGSGDLAMPDIECFLGQLGWRDFSHYLLHHFPELPSKNLQPKFDNFAWQKNKAFLQAWQTGQTGYPLVDAGMRELQQTGYMHNRVRMVTASFLVKNLLLHWRHGWEWFWQLLVDADVANNSANWQWVAGSGTDAAPYFRIFNPMLQGEKFDKHGEYTRRFVPELKNLPDRFLFKPWKAPETVLTKAGVSLGANYPWPIVDFAASRLQALKYYRQLRSTKK